jgi:hypothetical protein
MIDQEIIKLQELAARCETEAPCHQLDADISVAIDGGELVWRTSMGTMESHAVRRIKSSSHVGGWAHEPVRCLTHSVNAALGLVPSGWWVQHMGQTLQGWGVRLECDHHSWPPLVSLNRFSMLPVAITHASLHARAWILSSKKDQI